jgi:hypothetical protein
MNALTLRISGTEIRQDADNRYCLNDLHKAAGGNPKHRPNYWLENQRTKELIAEIEIAGIPAIQAKQGLGTYVCKELVYDYAMWISPAFSLLVIRAYDALVTGAVPPGPINLAQYRKAKAMLDNVQIILTGAEYEDLLASHSAPDLNRHYHSDHRHGHNYWTEGEDKTLVEGVQAGKTREQLAELLPGRTVDAIKKRVALLRRDGDLPVA